MSRGRRNREAIIDALVASYEAGSLRPSVEEVANRAGVSARSVHNHFADVEALRAEVAQRQWERHFRGEIPVIEHAGVHDRINAIVEFRARVFEGVTPVRRAALLVVHDSPAIASNIARLDRVLRRRLAEAFPDADNDTLDALDATLSWDTWHRLRGAQGCSNTRAKRVLVRAVTALLDGSTT